MAGRKHARIVSQEDRDDSDTGGDTEPDTPRPTHRQGSKRRISERHDNDSSFNSNTGRAPLRSVNINDDTAEKRRRRKSTKLAVIGNAEAGPSERQEQAEPSKTAQAKQKPLNSVLPQPVINVPLDVMNSNFEEWMKMATDNVGALLLYPGLCLMVTEENKCYQLVEFCAHRLFP